VRSTGEALEIFLSHDQHGWSEAATCYESADDERVIVGQAVLPDHQLHFATVERGTPFGLEREIGVVTSAVDQCIDATIRQRQEYVKRASRLLGQGRPESEFEDLPRRAGLVTCEPLDINLVHALQVSFLP